MIRHSVYSIINDRTGEEEDCVAEARFPLRIKDAVIGSGLAIGGVLYMLVKAFKYGAEKLDEGQTKTMNKLGLISDSGNIDSDDVSRKDH